MEVKARLLVVISVILTNIYVAYSEPGKCGLIGMDRIIPLTCFLFLFSPHVLVF